MQQATLLPYLSAIDSAGEKLTGVPYSAVHVDRCSQAACTRAIRCFSLAPPASLRSWTEHQPAACVAARMRHGVGSRNSSNRIDASRARTRFERANLGTETEANPRRMEPN